MKEELTRSKAEFEKALATCRFDLREAENEISFYLKEKDSALADAEAARMQLRKLEDVVSNLEKERDYERERNQRPWWETFWSELSLCRAVNF